MIYRKQKFVHVVSVFHVVMHFNDEELALTAVSVSQDFSKEGILFTKPYKKSQKKSKSTKGLICFTYCS